MEHRDQPLLPGVHGHGAVRIHLVPVVHSTRYVGVEEYVRARGLKDYRRVGGSDVDVGKCAQDERKQFVVGLVKEPESYAPRIGRVKGGEVAKCHQESHH
jgi:hypothetical protein